MTPARELARRRRETPSSKRIRSQPFHPFVIAPARPQPHVVPQHHVHLRHLHVEKDQVRPPLADTLDCLATVLRFSSTAAISCDRPRAASASPSRASGSSSTIRALSNAWRPVSWVWSAARSAGSWWQVHASPAVFHLMLACVAVELVQARPRIGEADSRPSARSAAPGVPGPSSTTRDHQSIVHRSAGKRMDPAGGSDPADAVAHRILDDRLEAQVRDGGVQGAGRRRRSRCCSRS